MINYTKQLELVKLTNKTENTFSSSVGFSFLPINIESRVSLFAVVVIAAAAAVENVANRKCTDQTSAREKERARKCQCTLYAQCSSHVCYFHKFARITESAAAAYIFYGRLIVGSLYCY